MFGRVPIVIAEEVQGSQIIRIFRELPYKRHILQEMGEECFTNIDEISRYLKTLLHRTSIEAVQGNAQSLINILAHIKNIYSRVSIGLNTMQEYMPRSLIRFYEKIDDLQKQLAQNKVNYNYNDAVVAEIDNMSEYMSKIRRKILSFWEQQPEIFIRLPSHLYFGVTPDLFLNDDYFPYIMGKRRLPRWMDPVAIDMMNEARKIYQTREQTIAQKEKYTNYLTLMTRTKSGVSSEIIALIVDYMPIHVVFELMQSISPSQFLEMDNDCEKIFCNDSISIYV